MGYPFGQSESAVLAVFLPSFLGSLLSGRAVQEAKKSMALCKHCCATTKTSVYYRDFFHQKFQTVLCEPLQRKLIYPSPNHDKLQVILCCITKSYNTNVSIYLLLMLVFSLSYFHKNRSVLLVE